MQRWWRVRTQYAVDLPPHAYRAHSAVFLASRVVGLCPVVVTDTGKKLIARWSPGYTLYSYMLLFGIVSFGIRGTLQDGWKGKAESVRMTSTTSIYVTSCDIIAVFFIAAVGVIGSPFRLSYLATFYKYLGQVDDAIGTQDTETAHMWSVVVMTTALILLSVVLGSDIAAWADTATAKLEFLQNYSCFYLAYYPIVLLELQFAQGTDALRRRFHRLNQCLKSMELRKSSRSRSSYRAIRVLPIADRHVGLEPHSKIRRISDISHMKNDSTSTNSIVSAEYITKLSDAHGILCDALLQLNNAFGFSALVIVSSCLLHLIETPYFLQAEVTGRGNRIFTALQIMWLVVHLGRLLLVIQPCHGALSQAKDTVHFVCKLLQMDIDCNLKKQLENFSLQLILRPTEFSACGMCRLDRPLLTTIAGAVTTYLVILIQFNSQPNGNSSRHDIDIDNDNNTHS